MIVKNTLMVIGNGFDLQCGLNSCYESFCDWLNKDTTRANSNIWAVHFLNAQCNDEHWAGVERQLHKTLNGATNRSNEITGTNYLNITLPKLWNESTISYFKRTSGRPASNEVEYLIKNSSKIGRASFPLDSYWFLDELKVFERQFSDYLQEEVASNKNYVDNAAKLMKMMSSNEDRIHLLSFNYTNPFKLDSSIPADNAKDNIIKDITNVHGTYYERNIIFGIDATETLSSDTYIFSKTYRKMLQNTQKNTLPPNVEAIKFYGHSLEQADYSYFQSIFDYYNLYEGRRIDSWGSINPVTLQFYYTVYDDSKETEIKRDATDSVYRLISTYGDKFDNKDKGKNLMHKLLLEGRVQIIFLEKLD